MIAVAAFDPGDTTGAAFLIADTTAVLRYTAMQHEQKDIYKQAAWVLNTWLGFRSWAYRIHDVDPKEHYLVMEDFVAPAVVRSTKYEHINPLRIIWLVEGMRIAFAEAYEEKDFGPSHHVPLVLQNPSHRSHVTDARLRRAGYWTRALPHARAATQHALLFLMRKGHSNVLAPNSRPKARI